MSKFWLHWRAQLDFDSGNDEKTLHRMYYRWWLRKFWFWKKKCSVISQCIIFLLVLALSSPMLVRSRRCELIFGVVHFFLKRVEINARRFRVDRLIDSVNCRLEKEVWNYQITILTVCRAAPMMKLSHLASIDILNCMPNTRFGIINERFGGVFVDGGKLLCSGRMQKGPSRRVENAGLERVEESFTKHTANFFISIFHGKRKKRFIINN